MNLLLLRHGLAETWDPARFPDDSQRPLSARGDEQMGKVAQAIRRLDLGIDLIWTSPLLRTRQTAAAVATALRGEQRVHVAEELAPEGDPGILLKELARRGAQPANVLFVGHEPYLSGLLSILTSGGSAVQARMKKAALARLEVDGMIRLARCATLSWLLPPKLLVRLD